MHEILIIEDDPGIGRGLMIHLQSENYLVSWAKSLAEAKIFLASTRFAIVLLDLGLPDGSGLDFLKAQRSLQLFAPVLILTAQTEEEIVVAGFEAGANDFVKKPFSTRELSARIKAHIAPAKLREEILRFGQLVMKPASRTAEHMGKIFDLNRKEFEILAYLMAKAEQAVTREALVAAIDKDGEIFDRTVDSHISHLRSRFRKAEITDIQIAAIYGIGYRLEKI